MTLEQLKARAMFQTGNDTADLGDFLPYAADYLNEGYERLLQAHIGAEAANTFLPLKHEKSEPDLPRWAHPALADYAAWRILMNGSPARQSRGAAFLLSFEQCENKLRLQRGGKTFRNLPH